MSKDIVAGENGETSKNTANSLSLLERAGQAIGARGGNPAGMLGPTRKWEVQCAFSDKNTSYRYTQRASTGQPGFCGRRPGHKYFRVRAGAYIHDPVHWIT